MNERLIGFFARNPGAFLSGAQISRELGCSRTAVWKQISLLREQGYQFEAVPRKGYRLLRRPSRLDVQRLLGRLQTATMGRTIRLYDSVDSTQNIAHELVRNGAQEGTLVLAEEQTSGRGRMGRNWHSPKGKGVWMSLVLKPTIPLPFISQLTLLTAVALCRTIRRLTTLAAGIKWPNDILIGAKKVSGILLETSAEDERLIYVIAGVGVSVNLSSDDYPDELLGIATSLMIETGKEIDREELISRFLEQFEELYGLFAAQGFAPIRLLWEALTITLQRPVRVKTASGVVEGIAEGIDDMGALQVRLADGSLVTLYSGDVETPAGTEAGIREINM